MQVTSEQTDPCLIVLNIEVDEQQVSKAFDAIYREFGKHANIRGFRPGKAPRALVERSVDANRVRERTLEKIITDTYPKAVEDQGVTPFRNPDIEPTDLEDKKPYTYKALVPLEPQVTLGEYVGLSVNKPIFPVTEEMIDERVARLREERARLERVTDRGVQEGDVLIAEVQTVEEGAEEPAPARRQLVQLGNNLPGFDEAILGLNPGEERTFELTYPEEHAEEEKRGKKVTYTVKLSSISAKKLPELNEDFFKAAAGVSTEEELKSLIRERMQTETVRLSDQITEQRLLEEIVRQSEIHFPEVLIREEVEDDLRRLSQELQQNKVSYAQYLAQLGQTAEQHQAQLAVQAENAIRTLLALRQIAIQEELTASDEAIEGEFVRLLAQGQITEEQFEEYRLDQRRRLQVANALIQQKLHDFLFANNTINEVEETTPADPEELAEANADAEEAENPVAEEVE